MDDLRRMAVFAAVVEQGSLSAAARVLGSSTSAVSQQLRRLERDGGVTLLHRTTRRLALTEAGERFHAECAALVAAAQRARAQLALSRDAPVGELRLAATVGFARHVAPALGGLLAAHPALTLHLLVDDARIDLVRARIDLAIRFGALPDSSWVARRLGAMEVWPMAAPAYLARHGVPAQPQDLAAHQWLGFVNDRQPSRLLLLAPGGRRERVSLRPRIASNNQLSLQQLCVAGLGVARLSRVDADEDLRAGRLQRVLAPWAAEPLPVWAVTPQRDAQPAKVRHVIDALQAYLRGLPGIVD
ncbi:MAG: LysR family transcriptional regulator [Rubrivivax sp.]